MSIKGLNELNIQSSTDIKYTELCSLNGIHIRKRSFCGAHPVRLKVVKYLKRKLKTQAPKLNLILLTV